MSKFIYRAIREDEDISSGIKVVCREKAESEEERARRLEYHIQNGSKDFYKNRYFISMTEKLEAAQKYRIGKEGELHKNKKIVLINTEKISTELIRVANIETSSLAKRLSSSTMISAKNYSAADSEVLSDDDIGPEHCKEISPLMLDVLDAINVTIAKDDEESKKERELLEFIQTVFFESDEFEKVLQDTKELSIYEQYFFERFYKQGKSMNEIANEMNNEIAKRDGKKIDLTVLESLKVGTIKRLLNSDKTLEYLKNYNDKKYNSQEISIQLEGAKQEKTKTKSLNQRSNEERLKLRQVEMYIKNANKQIKDLEARREELEQRMEKISIEQEAKETGFYGNLRSNVYSTELAEINQEMMRVRRDIKVWKGRIVEYDEISIEKKRLISIQIPEQSDQLLAKYHGVVIKKPRSCGKLELLSERPKRTTASKSGFEKLKNSNGCIACGETAYSLVERDEELVYTGGTTSGIRLSDNGTVLVCFASEWKGKERGGEGNRERIGKERVTRGNDSSFGLHEILSIVKGANLSPDLKTKCEEARKSYNERSKQAALEFKEELEKRRERKNKPIIA